MSFFEVRFHWEYQKHVFVNIAQKAFRCIGQHTCARKRHICPATSQVESSAKCHFVETQILHNYNSLWCLWRHRWRALLKCWYSYMTSHYFISVMINTFCSIWCIKCTKANYCGLILHTIRSSEEKKQYGDGLFVFFLEVFLFQRHSLVICHYTITCFNFKEELWAVIKRAPLV